MLVREYRSADLEVLQRIWDTQGLAKEFPDLTAPDFVLTEVVEDEGRIIAAASGRKTIEGFIFVDRHAETSSPHRRWEAVKMLERALGERLTAQGFREGHIFVDPRFKRFGVRMEELGWVRTYFLPYAKEFRG